MPRDESAATNTARTGSHHALTSADGRRAAHPGQTGPTLDVGESAESAGAQADWRRIPITGQLSGCVGRLRR